MKAWANLLIWKSVKNNQTFMFDIGTKEIVIIAVVLLLLFGPKKIPELAKAIGDSIKSVRNAFKKDDSAKK